MNAISIKQAVVIGGGPAGLMAAEALLKRGVAVDLYDAMPSLGRKFLMAGKSGLNLTHAEAYADFLARFGKSAAHLKPILDAFGPDQVQDWARGLGIEVFTGTSGRVFPKDFKAAPLLRAWLRRLRADGLRTHVRHRWQGWDDQRRLMFATPNGAITIQADTTIIALGGASWPTLGSDAAWVPWLEGQGVRINPLKPSNCGFDADWSETVVERAEGQPLKRVRLSFGTHSAHGECVVTKTGLEGGPVYAQSSVLRDAIEKDGHATLDIDLLPDLSEDDIRARLAKPKGKASMATHLKKTLKLDGAKAALLREGTDKDDFADPARLAARIKALPVTLIRPRPIAEAISSAGGVAWDQVTETLELKAIQGVFVAGEMLDWDAPTGGYLLTACMATGRWAGEKAAKSHP